MVQDPARLELVADDVEIDSAELKTRPQHDVSLAPVFSVIRPILKPQKFRRICRISRVVLYLKTLILSSLFLSPLWGSGNDEICLKLTRKIASGYSEFRGNPQEVAQKIARELSNAVVKNIKESGKGNIWAKLWNHVPHELRQPNEKMNNSQLFKTFNEILNGGSFLEDVGLEKAELRKFFLEGKWLGDQNIPRTLTSAENIPIADEIIVRMYQSEMQGKKDPNEFIDRIAYSTKLNKKQLSEFLFGQKFLPTDQRRFDADETKEYEGIELSPLSNEVSIRLLKLYGLAKNKSVSEVIDYLKKNKIDVEKDQVMSYLMQLDSELGVSSDDIRLFFEKKPFGGGRGENFPGVSPAGWKNYILWNVNGLKLPLEEAINRAVKIADSKSSQGELTRPFDPSFEMDTSKIDPERLKAWKKDLEGGGPPRLSQNPENNTQSRSRSGKEVLEEGNSPLYPQNPKNDTQLQPTKKSSALDELKEMVGLEEVVEELSKIIPHLEEQAEREKSGLKTVTPTLHGVFKGNPGTGKTTVARAYGRLLREQGFLGGDTKKAMPVVEVGGADLAADSTGAMMDQKIKEAEGGILLIDEIYEMDPAKNPSAKIAVGKLLKAMEDKRGEFVVVGTGYSKQVDDFMASNPGFERRFVQKLHFNDYDDGALQKIMGKMAKDKDYHITDEAMRAAVGRLGRMRGPGFGNAGSVRNIFEEAVKRHSSRMRAASTEKEPSREERTTLTLEDFEPKRKNIDETLSKLDKLVGLKSVKESLRETVSLLQLEKQKAEKGVKSERPPLNATFEGNPGTGKTTVAKIYGETLRDLGYLSDGEVIVVKASDLLGTAVGESAKKTQNILDRARGKVLVIDEAYQLYQEGGGSNVYGKEVIDTMVANIQPDTNQDMVVLLTGYPQQMADLMRANPGLQRRFGNKIHFEDYSDAELKDILIQKAKEKGLHLGADAIDAAVHELSLQRTQKDFGNAGAVTNLLGNALRRQASRLPKEGATKEDFMEIKAEDIAPPKLNPKEAMADVDRLEGLNQVKEELDEMRSIMQMAKRKGESPRKYFEPYITFSGPVGTGKTTVAENMGKFFHSLGVLLTSEVKKISAEELVAGYVGQTSLKTKKVLEDSLGKTLVIQNAGQLSDSRNSFNKQAVDTLTSFMKEHHGKFSVIFSGEESEIANLMREYPALAGQIGKQLRFHELTEKEGANLLKKWIESDGKKLDPSAEKLLSDAVEKLKTSPNFTNGNDLKGLLRKIYARQAVRLSEDEGAEFTEVRKADVEEALESYLKAKGVPSSGHLQKKEGSKPEPPVAFEGQEPLPPPVTRTTQKTAENEKPMATKEGKDNQNEPTFSPQNPQYKKTISWLDSVSKSGDAGLKAVHAAISGGKISDELAKTVQEQFQKAGEKKSIEEVKLEIEKSLTDAKNAVEKETKPKEASQGKNGVKHRRCLACGRSNCNYMPYEWTTLE